MGQKQEYPPPPSDSSDVETLLAHQTVIAQTHADGSYFMTPQGTYVQLVNGVLTNVEFEPSPPASVHYSQLQFPEQNVGPHSFTGQSPNYNQTQSLPPLSYGKANSSQSVQQQNAQHSGQQPINSSNSLQHSNHVRQFQEISSSPTGQNQLANQNQSLRGSVTSSQMSQAPTVSHLSQASSHNPPSEDQRDTKEQENTRMNMRIQRDMANLAGIKCSQF